MKKIITSLILFILSINLTIGQESSVLLKGKVQDSLNSPIEFSNIVVYNGDSRNILTYAISDGEGKFQVEIYMDSLYTLEVSYLGFDKYVETFKGANSGYKTIILKESSSDLDEVTVVYDLPIKISGDTVSYKVDAFTNGNERKLKDVFEKLPGFEVDDDGNVKVQGKKVSKIMVDGKDFFSGDTKLATKNIPADVVEKVNVLKNFSDIQPLRGLEDNENYVIDIRLKEGKKNILFGSLEGGLGLNRRFNNHANIFYYNPKISINFIGDLNNIGEQSFTFQDYFKFNGGFDNAGKNSSFKLSSDLLGLALLQDNKAENIVSKLGALNYTFNPSEKLSISGFIIHSEINFDISSTSLKTYIRENEKTVEELTSNVQQGSISDLVKLSTKYVPNNKLHIEYDLLLNATRLKEDNNLGSKFEDEENNIRSRSSNKPISVLQKFGVYFAQDEKNIYSLETNYTYKKRKNPFRLFTQQKPFADIIPLSDSDNYYILQNFDIETHGLNSGLNYYYVINKTNHINFFAGIDYNNQNFYSNIVQTSNENRNNFTDPGLQNDTEYNYLNSHSGFNYRTKLNKLTIDFGLALHHYNVENKQIQSRFKFDKTLLLPDIKFKYNFKNARILSLNYNLDPEFSDIQRISEGVLIKNYNSLFRGNQTLKNALYHNMNLNYYDFNAYNFSNLYAVLSYQIKKNDFNNTITYNGINSLSSPVNIENPNNIFTGSVSYDRRLKKIKVNASTNFSAIKFKSILNDLLVENNSITQDYKFSVETRIDDFPILELGFEKIINNYNSDAFANQSYVINNPFANIEVSFLKHFIITADYQFTLYKNKTANSRSEYDFLNSYLYYKKQESNFEFKLTALNILNTTTIRRDTFSNNYISTSEYLVQPRYFLFSIIYNF